MSQFSTHLSLGQKAFGVECTSYRPDYRVRTLTVGQIRVRVTSPKTRGWDGDGWDLALKQAIEAKLRECNT